ncbi:MAG: NAD(P)-binding protein [Deltaproteobacteria bacterium]|nr:NAD(P)-binding protein [Deltaproteobacteria bacterium]
MAIIGGRPAGISAAWQLWLKGHEPVIFETAKELGGKITSAILSERMPRPRVQSSCGRDSRRPSQTKG